MSANLSIPAVALDVNVYVPDLSQGMPETGMPVWQYRREVDKDWQPDPATYPAVQAEPLPSRRSDLATEAINDTYKVATRKRIEGEYDLLPTKNPKVQVIGVTDSLDLRGYHDGRTNGPAGSMFLNTVHNCFAKHYPLGILPQNLLWMVLHEIAVTTKLYPESYRRFFSTEKEKQLLDVRVDGLDIARTDQLAAWSWGIELLTEKLREKVPTDLLEYFLPTLSTHTMESRTASMIAVLDAASPYYDYLMRTLCGIPKIRLFGCGEDYDAVYESCLYLAGVFSEHLKQYFKYLLPVLKEIADTASARKAPDNEFWSSIYNHHSGSGRDDMNGWITAFVNYRQLGGQFYQKEEELYDWKKDFRREPGYYGMGINRKEIPVHLSSVPFIWQYSKDHSDDQTSEFAGRNFGAENDGNGVKFDCRLVGGFMAVEDYDGYATTVLNFAVLRGEEISATGAEVERRPKAFERS